MLDLNISNTVKPNITALLTAAEWDGFAQVRLIVDPGALVNTLTIPALAFPTLPRLLVGAGARIGGVSGGGDALYTRTPIEVENYGTISGGGGGGGNGGGANVVRDGQSAFANGGSGGRGAGFQSNSLTILSSTSGGPGTFNQVTTPSWGGGDLGYARAHGGDGGSGGSWRQSGSAGTEGYITGSYMAGSYANPGGGGGAAGLNVNGIEYITWIVRGDA